MDEACAMVRTEIESMPTEIDEIRRRILQLEIEREALKKETDEASKKRLAALEEELAEEKAEYDALIARWETEKKELEGEKNIKEAIDRVRHEIEEAERNYDLEKLSALKYGELPKLEEQLKQEQTKEKGDGKLIKEEVTEEEIAEVVSKWTGIPVAKLAETEREKLLHLDEILKKRVVGQADATKAVSDAVLRARAGLKAQNRPIGSFIFLGPTGVGKTETAKALTEALFDDERNMIRIDMSEYMEKHSVSRLVGSPPGYVGYDEGGQISEEAKDAVNREMKEHFRPEFLNRVDEIVLFKPLLKEEIVRIIDTDLAEIEGRLEDRDIHIAATDEAKDKILSEAYNVLYGARPVKRYIQNHIETKLSRALIAGDIMDGDHLEIAIDGDDYVIR